MKLQVEYKILYTRLDLLDVSLNLTYKVINQTVQAFTCPVDKLQSDSDCQPKTLITMCERSWATSLLFRIPEFVSTYFSTTTPKQIHYRLVVQHVLDFLCTFWITPTVT